MQPFNWVFEYQLKASEILTQSSCYKILFKTYFKNILQIICYKVIEKNLILYLINNFPLNVRKYNVELVLTFKQPILWLHNFCLKVNIVHFNNMRLLGAKVISLRVISMHQTYNIRYNVKPAGIRTRTSKILTFLNLI